MRAAVLRGAEDLVVEEVDELGSPPEGWVVVAPTAVGLCGSDIHYYHGDVAAVGDADDAFPRLLGHEFTGVVAELGPGVNRPDLEIGTRVVVLPLEWCGNCPPCREGKGNVCYELKIVGVHRDGALAQRMLIDADKVFPTTAPADIAPFIEPVSVSAHALAVAGIDAESRAEGVVAVVVGGGAIGLAALLALTSWGARVAVIDPSQSRRELARALGAEATLWSDGDDLADQVRRFTGEYGADLVVDSTGAAAVLGRSIGYARKAGTVLVLGLTGEPATISAGALPIDELRVQGTSCATPKDFATAIRLVEDRVDDVRPLITHRFPLERAAEAFETAAGGAEGVVKVVVDL